MKRAFRQVNVFSADPLRGNPLAVVHDADGLGIPAGVIANNNKVDLVGRPDFDATITGTIKPSNNWGSRLRGNDENVT